MTQDCSSTPSIADENKSHDNTCFPKGIHITETDNKSGSGIESMSCGESGAKEDDIPWGYLFVHNKQVELFKKQMDTYNQSHPEAQHQCFIHYSYKFKQKSNGKGVIKMQKPTISGLVFLQGYTKDLQAFLRDRYPFYHLINDCSTERPASISHKVMKSFMQVVNSHPENVTFLRDPFVKFANNHVKLRILTGIFKGMEGYIVRVDRDRQLVMEFGGYAVAIRGVHNEDFEVVEEK